MKRIFYIICLFIAVVLDLYLVARTFYFTRVPINEYWFYHLILAGIFYILNRIYFKRDISYFDVLIIIFPVVGFGGLLFIEMLPEVDSRYEDVEEAAEFESYVRDNMEVDYIDVETELGVIGAYDSLMAGTPREKKKFLMGFNPPEISFKVEILKKALHDEDIDVIHYAAVDLNDIDEGFQKEISESERGGSREEMFRSYMRYIESGLPEGEILRFYREKALKALKGLEGERWIVEELQLMKDLNMVKRCEERLENLLKEGAGSGIVEFALKFYYERNNYRRVLQLREGIISDTGVIPFHLKRHIEREERYG